MDINLFRSKFVSPEIQSEAYGPLEVTQVNIIGKVVFVNGVSKNADFDTISDPIDLSLFDEGEIRVTVADKADTPDLVVQFGTVDFNTGAFDSSGAIEFTDNGHGKIKYTSGLFSNMAINATLLGGSFTVTITGEFKKSK